MYRCDPVLFNHRYIFHPDLSGADLTGCIFLAQAQVNSAKGNQHTQLPRYLKHPAHWSFADGES